MTDTEIRELASLCRLALTEEEVAQFRTDLAAIVEHIDSLQSVDTEGLVPLSHVLEMTTTPRRDEPGESLPPAMALGPSKSDDDQFVVPAILPGEGS